MSSPEAEAVRARYERRKTSVERDRYSALNGEVWQSMHERQRVMLRFFARRGLVNFDGTRLLEIGCGGGSNLLEFLRLGFRPENLGGIELLEDRVALANRVLPSGIVRGGDALRVAVEPSSWDIVFQSVVFSSILDLTVQQELAARMWTMLKPGGGILWYDFTFDNPNNPDVRGIPTRRLRALFPEGHPTCWRVTLAPPLARRVCKIHSGLYPAFNAFPFLRTHVLAWIEKPA